MGVAYYQHYDLRVCEVIPQLKLCTKYINLLVKEVYKAKLYKPGKYCLQNKQEYSWEMVYNKGYVAQLT